MLHPLFRLQVLKYQTAARETERSFRKQLLSWLLVGLFVVDSIYTVGAALDRALDWDDPFTYIAVFQCVLVALLYWLNRRGHYFVAAASLVLLFLLGTFVAAVFEEEARYVNGYLYFLVGGILLSYVLFSYRIMLLYSSASIAISVGFLIVYGDEYFLEHINVVFYLLMISVLIYIVLRFQDRLAAFRADELERNVNSQAQLLSAAFDGVAIIDHAGIVHEATPSFAALLGYHTPGAIVGNRIFEVDAFANDNTGWRGLAELAVSRTNGTQIYLEATVREQSNMFVVAVRDISQRRQQQTLLIRRADYFSALHQTALALMRFQESEEIFTRILRYAATLVGTEHGFIVLSERTTSLVKAGIGHFETVVGQNLAVNLGLTAYVLQAGQSIIIHDFQKWEERDHVFDNIPMYQAVAIPLTVQHQHQGYFALTHAASDKQFTEDDIEILTQFADLAALATANARLYVDLLNNQEMLAAIVNNTSDAIYIKDLNGRYLLFNPASARIFNTSVGEIIGVKDSDLFQPDFLRRINRIDQQVIESGVSHTYEFSLKGSDDEERTYLATKFPYLSTVNEVQGIVAISRDITVMKQAEHVLRRSEAYYRALIDNALDIILIVTRRGSVRFMSPSLERVLGYSPAAIEETPILNLVHAEDVWKVIRHFVKIGKKQALPPLHCRIRHANGDWRVLEIMGLDRTDIDVIGGFIISARDITERKAAEVALQQHLQGLKGLHEASIRLTEASTLEAVLDALIKSTASVFPQMTSATIHMVNPGNGRLESTRALPLDDPHLAPMSFAPGEGIAGRSFVSRNVVSVRDVLDAVEFLHVTAEKPLYRSLLVVPLMSREEPIGTLSITAAQVAAFSRNDELIADMLARETAILIDRVQLFNEERRQRRFSDALSKLSYSLNSAMTLDELFNLILFHVSETIPCESSNILLLQQHQNRASIVHHRGYDGSRRHIIDHEFDVTEFPNLSRSIRTHEPVLVADVNTATHWKFLPETTWIQSHVVAPILSHDKVIGFLNLDSSIPGFFTEADAQRLTAFANQLGVAIEKVRLIESEQHQREISDTLRDIANTLTRSTDRDALLHRFLEQLARLVPFDAASVWAVDDSGASHYLVGKGFEKFGVEDIVRNTVHRAQTDDLMRRVVEAQEVVVVPDTTAFEFAQGDFSYIKSWACAPIVVQGKLYGKLALDHTSPGFYGDHHARLLETLTKQLSVSLENVILFEQVQQYNSVLEQLVAERTVELERERLQLQTILASMDEGVVYVDYQRGDPHPTIQYANQSFAELIGLSLEALVGMPITVIGNRVDSRNIAMLDFFLKPASTRIALPRKEWRGEVRLQTTNSGVIECAMTVLTVNVIAARQLWSVAVIRDISQEKALAAQRERFVANASHELRTPLSNLVTRMYLLKNQPDKAAVHIEVMERTIQRLTTLAEDLLDVTRYNQHAITIDTHHLDLRQVVGTVIELQQAAAELKGLRIVADFVDEPVMVQIDENRFYQVVTNLIVNAISYSSENTQIAVHIDATANDVTLCVADQGFGIEPDLLPHIFEPFFRASEGKVSGTGLGLTISKEIVELHDGDIWVESELNRGSRFFVRLPRLPQD